MKERKGFYSLSVLIKKRLICKLVILWNFCHYVFSLTHILRYTLGYCLDTLWYESFCLNKLNCILLHTFRYILHTMKHNSSKGITNDSKITYHAGLNSSIIFNHISETTLNNFIITDQEFKTKFSLALNKSLGADSTRYTSCDF